jgi:hypothetical protein
MFTMKLKVAKEGFFDREKVKRAIDVATRKNLSKFGAFVWRKSRSSIRKRKKASPPGKPPSGHDAELLKKFIFFVYEDKRKSVIIGPTRLNKIGNAPEALEYGGQSEVFDKKKLNTKPIEIEERPYMRPAFEDTKKKLPEIWKNSIK